MLEPVPLTFMSAAIPWAEYPKCEKVRTTEIRNPKPLLCVFLGMLKNNHLMLKLPNLNTKLCHARGGVETSVCRLYGSGYGFAVMDGWGGCGGGAKNGPLVGGPGGGSVQRRRMPTERPAWGGRGMSEWSPFRASRRSAMGSPKGVVFRVSRLTERIINSLVATTASSSPAYMQ